MYSAAITYTDVTKGRITASVANNDSVTSQLYDVTKQLQALGKLE